MKGFLPSKYTYMQAQTYNTPSSFTSHNSPLLCCEVIQKESLAYTFKIIIHTVVCLISFSFTRKGFGLCMFCLLLHMLSRHFLINECGYHYGGYTTLLLNTNERQSLYLRERRKEKSKVLIDLLAVHHVFLSEDGGGRASGYDTQQE